MLAREETMESEELKGELQKVLPVINSEGSDSAMLDNTLEFLVMSGMDLPLAVMIMIPEPWANNNTMSQKKKRLLSVLCNHDGAVGWTSLHSFLRWRCHGSCS